MIKMVISAFFATIGFAVMFNIRGKKLIYSALGGSVAAFVYYLCSYTWGFDNFISLFWASVTLAIYSEFMARKLKAPVTVFAICALICFVPGGGMYYTMLAIVNQHNMEALTLLIDTLSSAGALALGIVLVSTLTGAYYRVMRRIKEKKI